MITYHINTQVNLFIHTVLVAYLLKISLNYDMYVWFIWSCVSYGQMSHSKIYPQFTGYNLRHPLPYSGCFCISVSVTVFVTYELHSEEVLSVRMFSWPARGGNFLVLVCFFSSYLSNHLHLNEIILTWDIKTSFHSPPHPAH